MSNYKFLGFISVFYIPFKPRQIEFPFGDEIEPFLGFVGFAHIRAHFGVTATVYFHIMVFRAFGVAFKPRSVYMYGGVAVFADGYNVFKFLHAVFLVVFPLFVRVERRGFSSARGALAARTFFRVFFDKIPLFFG